MNEKFSFTPEEVSEQPDGVESLEKTEQEKKETKMPPEVVEKIVEKFKKLDSSYERGGTNYDA